MLAVITPIQDLSTDQYANGQPAYTFAVSGDHGFFLRDGASGIGSFWVTDGVTATRLAGADPSGSFYGMLPIDGGIAALSVGVGDNFLMRSDGTAAGTYSLGTVSGAHHFIDGPIAPFVAHGHYFATDELQNGGFIWETDGNTLWRRGQTIGGLRGVAEYSGGIIYSTTIGLFT